MEEILVVFEEGVKKDFHKQFQFFNGETLGLLDIVVAATSCTYEAFQEACDVEVFTPGKMPKFFMWVNALKEHPLVKETLPPHDKLVAKIKSIIGT
jgi:glutathione S-transferase